MNAVSTRAPRLALVIAAALAPPVAWGEQPAARPDGSAAVPDSIEQVKRLSNEEVQAFLRKDANALARLWSDDLVVTNPVNKLVTKQDVLGMITSGVLVITSFDRTIEYSHAYQKTVVLAGTETVTWGGRMPNAGKTERLRFTAVWMNQRGRWQEVARHANTVPPA